MQGKVHVAVGFGCLAVLCAKYPTGFTMDNGAFIIPEIGLFTASLGSLLPDIDLGRSSMGMKHKIASKVVSKVGGGHRGITHTLLVPVILTVLTSLAMRKLDGYYWLQTISSSLMFGLTFGYIMHIVADLFNGKGCPLLWPISKSKISVADIPSEGKAPWIFMVVFVSLFAALVFGGILL